MFRATSRTRHNLISPYHKPWEADIKLLCPLPQLVQHIVNSLPWYSYDDAKYLPLSTF